MALVVGLTVVGPPASAGDTGDADAAGAEQEIRDAYALVFDRSAPMPDRLAAIEDGRRLQSTLEKFEGLARTDALPVTIESVSLVVHSVRVHAKAAEVELSVMVNGALLTGWNGVARKFEGRWVVARGTLCTLLVEWTPLRCPGGPDAAVYAAGPAVESRSRDGETVLELTFPDGDGADLVVPSDLADGWRASPRAELRLDDGTPVPIWFEQGTTQVQQPVLRYRGASGRRDVVLDAMRGLAVSLDGWTAYVMAEDLTERERRLVAGHLEGYTTKTGFPVLTPLPPLQFRDPPQPAPAPGAASLVKSALNVDAAASPVELSWSKDEQYTTVVVTPGACPAELQRPYSGPDFLAEERCLPDGVGRIAVEGHPSLTTRLLETVRLVRYRPAAAVTSA